jgi:hypothetical protein
VGNSRGARKLARTPHVNQKKNIYIACISKTFKNNNKKRHLDITRLNTISPAEHMGKSTSITMLFVDLGKLYHAWVNLIQFSPSDSSSHGNTEAHTLVDQEC